MYYPYFITYMLTGLVISVVVFLWALRNRQFSEQQRARFLPLEEADRTEPARVSKSRMQLLGIIAVVLAVVGTSCASLIYSLIAP